MNQHHTTLRKWAWILCPLSFLLWPGLAAAGPAPVGEGASLTVSVMTPQGRVDRVSQFTIGFSEPMVPLGRMERKPEDVPVRATCAQGGSYRWINVSALAYLFDKPLPPSTGCKVTVPEGTTSLAGHPLAARRVFQFETPRIEVVRSQPPVDATNLDLSPEISITFNQPVRLAPLQKLARFHAAETFIPAEVRPFPEPEKGSEAHIDLERSYIFKPAAPLPADSAFTLELAAGLVPELGTLKTAEPIVLSFHTFVRFAVTGAACHDECRPECDPLGYLRIELTTPVRNLASRKFVHFDPPIVEPKTEGDEAEAASDSDEPVQSDWDTTNLYFHGPFEPDTSYTVHFDPEMTDIFGQKLGGSEPRRIEFGPYRPLLEIGHGGEFGIFESAPGKGSRLLPLKTRNLSEATLRAHLLPKDRVIPFLKRIGRERDEPDQEPLDPLIGEVGVYTQLMKFPGPRNSTNWFPIDMNAVFGDGLTGGLAYLDAESEELRTIWSCKGEREWERAVVEVTDTALSLKAGYFNTLIWTTSLTHGTPLADVDLEIRNNRNEVLWRGKSDKNGLAVGPGSRDLSLERKKHWDPFPDLWVFAEKSGEMGMIHTRWSEGVDPWSFDLDYEEMADRENLLAYSLTERPIYRPGEKVHWKSILRSIGPDHLVLPTKDKVHLAIQDSRGDTLFTGDFPVSPYGSISGELDLPATAKLGTYSITTGFATDNARSSGTFVVEEYKPANLKVEVTSGQPEAFPGDTLGFAARARYHFGAPVSGRELAYHLTREISAFSPAPLESYSTSDFMAGEQTYESPRSEDVASGNLTLSDEGEASFTQAVPKGEKKEPVRYTFEGSVTQEDQRVVAGRADLLVHPARFYLGVKLGQWGVEKGKPVPAQILAARPDGTIEPGARVEVVLTRRIWHVVRTLGTGSFYRHETSVENKEIARKTVTTASTPVTADFVPPDPGFYIVTASTRDEDGNPIQVSTCFYVWGEGIAGWERYDHDRIDLVPEKPTVRAGETARILVKSPYEEAEGLLTVEREGVIRHERIRVQGSAQLLEVPIRAEDAPNVFVSVVLVKGRISENFDRSGADLGKPSFKMGYAKLRVLDATRKLAVSVATDKEKYEPREEVSVGVEVRATDGSGVPSEVALLAVDEAILQLLSWNRYDPYDFFYGPRPISVRSADSRTEVIGRRLWGKKGENPGGGGGEGLRRDIRATAFWKADAVTGPDGKVAVQFRLPENLTSFRIVAIAADAADRFGTGSRTIQVSKPLVLQPAAPRFLMEGDEVWLGAVAHNNSGAPGDLEATLEGSGFERADGGGSVHFALAAGKAQEVLFKVRALRGKEAVFQVRARLDDAARDGIEIKLPVKDTFPMEAYATYGATRESASTKLLIPADVRTDRGSLEVAVSSSLAGTLVGNLEYLADYPYECLEQRISKVIAYLIHARYRGRIGLKEGGPDGIDIDEALAYVKKVLKELPAFQGHEGGFQYWPSCPEDPYLSAYTILCLQKMKAWGQGDFDEATLKKAVQYVDGVVRFDRWPWWYGPEAIRTCRAFILSVLAREGKLGASLIEKTYVDREKLCLFATAALFDTLGRIEPAGERYADARRLLMNRAVVTSGETHFEEVSDDGYEAVLLGPVRGNAAAMMGLLAWEKKLDEASAVMRWLVEDQKAGRWATTHEIAWGLLAASEYLDGIENVPPDFTVTAKLSGRELMKEAFRSYEGTARRYFEPMEKLPLGKPATLDLEKAGEGILYYVLRLRAAYQNPEDKAVNAGFTIDRAYEVVDEKQALAARRAKEETAASAKEAGEKPAKEKKPRNEPPPPTRTDFHRGDLVRVTLTLDLPALRHFVMVDDPLPAGFEAVSFNLATTARSQGAALDASPAEVGSERIERMALSGGWGQWYDHVEMRDDRVILFAGYLPAGTYHYSYLARALSPGSFAVKAGRVEEMYSPEVYGRGSLVHVEVAGE